MKGIVAVDDDPEILDLLRVALEHPTRTVHTYSDPLKALEGIPTHGADLIVSDLAMPGMNGIEFLKVCRERFPSAKIVILTGQGGIREAVQAMKQGATDFLTKPMNIAEMSEKIGKLLELQDVARTARTSSTALRAVAADRPMEEALKLAETVAARDSTVLIAGETGVGKEVLADFIQVHSGRAREPYIKVNCVALPESLIESELFGHERGAFTGASERRSGRFERASRGTLFLDEIAELPLPLQPKLLRVLQSREVERIGGDAAIKVDFRLICATNRDLAGMVKAGKFREDLFFRISVFPIVVPPLRQRPRDILTLATQFLERSESIVRKGKLSLAADAREVLAQYSWPGNVRELENAVERATIMAKQPVLTAADFWWLTQRASGDVEPPGEATAAGGTESPAHGGDAAEAVAPADVSKPLDSPLDEAERQTLVAILEKNRWNYSRAAQELKVSRSTLYAKAARYGIKR